MEHALKRSAARGVMPELLSSAPPPCSHRWAPKPSKGPMEQGVTARAKKQMTHAYVAHYFIVNQASLDNPLAMSGTVASRAPRARAPCEATARQGVGRSCALGNYV